MIGPMVKGIAAAKITLPDEGEYGGIDLKILPQYICYKAALLREKLVLQYVIMLLAGCFLIYFAISRHEISSIYEKLRQKEYILAPGVNDFIPASPSMVSDSYVNYAVTDFIGLLGNVNPTNIEEQYQALSESMSRDLKVRFDLEANDWKKKVKEEQLSEVFTVLEKEIETDSKGNYRAVAIGRVDSYVNSEHLGFRDEVIEMGMRLIPPKTGKRWYLELTNLARSSLDTFRSKAKIETKDKGKTHE